MTQITVSSKCKLLLFVVTLFLCPFLAKPIYGSTPKFTLSEALERNFSGKVNLDGLPLNVDSTIRDNNIDHIRYLLGVVLMFVRTSKDIFTYEMMDKHKFIKHMCIDECMCIAMRLQPHLAYQKIRHRTLMISSSGRNIMMTTSSGQRSYVFHVVTVAEISKKWWVIDPLVLDAKILEPIGEWILRIADQENLSAILL